MYLLALETATSVCSVALLQDDRVVVELTLDRPRAHAENLVPMVDDSLRYAGIEPMDVDAVAISAGPGSYTGLRIGVSTAKGFAAAVTAELVSVSSLKALAMGVATAESGDHIAAAFDARRDEIYAGVFRVGEDGRLLPESEISAVRSDEIADWLGTTADRLWLVGNGWLKLIERLEASGMRFTLLSDIKPSASSVALEGAEKFKSRHTEDLVTFEPYYLKEFVAKTPVTTPFERLSF